MATEQLPKTLTEAVRYFADADNCLRYLASRRWPNGVTVCPTCGGTAVRFIATRRLWECNEKHSRKQFSIKVGTIFEDSPLGLDKWLPTVWMIVNCKNGISSWEIHRAIGVTQKTAWFMLHRIRLAMQDLSTGGKLAGEVEVDETFIGGKARNMHKDVKARKITGTGPMGKSAVMGLLQRHGAKGSTVRAKVVSTRKKHELQAEIREHVKAGAFVCTDDLASYNGLATDYTHNVINHAECYARGNVHVNGLENFWPLLKRGLNGTYVSVEPFHLFRYLDEQAFRFNNRWDDDAFRFNAAICGIVGRRLTYKELIGALGDEASMN